MSRSLDILAEACASLPHVARKMFGGHGFFAPNGGMFAGIVTDDEVILKLQRGPARDELIAEGGKPWVYEGMGRPAVMAEWIVIPSGFYDDLEALERWVRRAHQLVPAKVARPRKAGRPPAGVRSTDRAPGDGTTASRSRRRAPVASGAKPKRPVEQDSTKKTSARGGTRPAAAAQRSAPGSKASGKRAPASAGKTTTARGGRSVARRSGPRRASSAARGAGKRRSTRTP